MFLSQNPPQGQGILDLNDLYHSISGIGIIIDQASKEGEIGGNEIGENSALSNELSRSQNIINNYDGGYNKIYLIEMKEPLP